ncbi:MAG: repair protein SbcC/Rad50, partial [Kosmotogales bacterium]|nr:repair protein SbcC/Rad50 [Kosmotogales bacterium]
VRYEELKEKEKETNDILDMKKEKRVTLESKIGILKSDYRKLKEQERHLKEINEKIKTIGSKEELLSEFRKNLKTLGQKIAERFRNDISSRATLNYNKISGLEERIIWDETYAIKLLSALDNMERDFTNLSGGEQVAVALCVRAALASVFSNAKIAIFDEPTQNLDRETREKLSEALNILFKDLEQTFIVSHENDFTEMASKTIRFEKTNGKTIVEEYE